LNTNYPAGWTRGMHFPQGNIVLSDGSVQQFSITRLKTALSNCWWQSNILAFPQSFGCLQVNPGSGPVVP
jgi:hypothetical protein